MAFSADDLTKVECAINVFAQGKRIVAETLGESMKQYAVCTLQQLMDLRDRMKEEVAAADMSTTRRTRLFRAAYSKGL